MQKLSFLPFEQLTPIWEIQDFNKILDLLNIKHSTYLNDEKFEMIAAFNKEQIQIKMSLKKNDESIVYPVEAVCIYENYAHISKQGIAQIILDYLDHYWSEYFREERDLFLPLDWSPYECEQVLFYMRGFIRDLNSEMKADFLLKEHGYGNYEIFPISSET